MGSDQNNHQTICPMNASQKNMSFILKYELGQLISRSKQVNV